MKPFTIVIICLISMLTNSCGSRNYNKQVLQASKQCEVLFKKNVRGPKNLRRNHIKFLERRSKISDKYLNSLHTNKRLQRPSLIREQITYNLYTKYERMKLSQDSIRTARNEYDGLNLLPIQSGGTQSLFIPHLPKASSIVMKAGKNDWRKESRISIFIGLAAVLALLGLVKFKRRMRELSNWAMRDPGTAQSILTSSRVIIGFSALGIGNILASHHYNISDYSTNLAIATTLGSLLLYPIRKSNWLQFRPNYLWRKTHDIALFASGVVLALYVGNKSNDFVSKFQAIDQGYQLYASIDNRPDVINHINNSVKKSDNDQPKKHVILKTIGLILALGLFALLTAVLGALACNIACSGFEAIALAVFIGGEFGLIALLISAVRWIFGIKKKKKSSIQNTSNA